MFLAFTFREFYLCCSSWNKNKWAHYERLEIATRKNIAGTTRTLRHYINTEATLEFKTPEERQYKVIRESTASASSILNVSIKETVIKNEADVHVYIHKAKNRDSLSGRRGVDLSINVSHQSGLGDNKEALHGLGERATCRNIFLHELGHFMDWNTHGIGTMAIGQWMSGLTHMPLRAWVTTST